MNNVIALLTVAGLVSTTNAIAQTSPDAVAVEPRVDVNVDLNVDKIEEMAERLRELAERKQEREERALEQVERRQELQERVRDRQERAREMASKQVPVAPVPPVSSRDPREKPRPAQRRRIPNGWVESTEPFTRSFPVGKGATLMLSNIAGNIQVTPGTADRIEVEALKHAWGPDAEQAKTRLGDATIETYAAGNRIELRVDHGNRRDARGVDVEFSVKVPADTTVDLRTVSGEIRVTNVKGEVRVQGVSGNMHLEGTARLAAVKTITGDVSITNAGADAQLSLSTVNGDLAVHTLNAPAVDVNTINGDIRIAGWSGDRANLRTLDGDLDLQISLTKGGRYEIESHSGDITLALPEQPGFELEAHTFNGRIRIDFPIKSEGPIRDGDRGPRSVRGTYGDASSSLRLQTFNGNLTVTRR